MIKASIVLYYFEFRWTGIPFFNLYYFFCRSNIRRLNYDGFYTVILEKGDELVSAASIRSVVLSLLTIICVDIHVFLLVSLLESSLYVPHEAFKSSTNCSWPILGGVSLMNVCVIRDCSSKEKCKSYIKELKFSVIIWFLASAVSCLYCIVQHLSPISTGSN